jgi:hypothetical protein
LSELTFVQDKGGLPSHDWQVYDDS